MSTAFACASVMLAAFTKKHFSIFTLYFFIFYTINRLSDKISTPLAQFCAAIKLYALAHHFAFIAFAGHAIL
jgi:hypothetical protein